MPAIWGERGEFITTIRFAIGILVDQFAGGNLPNARRTIVTGGDDVFAGGRETGAASGICMAAVHSRDHCGIRDVPDDVCAVVAGGDGESAVG